MPGTNTAAAEAALSLVLQIWESLISGKYMKEASQYSEKTRCPTCDSPRVCYNYFCLQCKTAGLCPIVFRGDHEHRHHPWLQVRHYLHQYSVFSTDLAHFISEEGLKHIHTVANKPKARGRQAKGGQRHCTLTSKNGASSSGASAKGKKSCPGCKASLPGAKGSPETFLVCSLQCLIEVVRDRPEWSDLLAMNDGAMQQMEPPLTFREKLGDPPRMLDDDTPTATPAPVTPQAPTGDSPMRESHEAATATTPTDEAPSWPQATGDSQTHEAATAAPTDEALPLWFTELGNSADSVGLPDLEDLDLAFDSEDLMAMIEEYVPEE